MPKDYAREENGTTVIMATSQDERYPPENMLDGKEGTFWVTTGCFPQEFVLAFAKPIQITQIVVMSINVKGLSIETCEKESPQVFEHLCGPLELANREGRLQNERHQVNPPRGQKARFLKFTIQSGYADFATINRVSVVGSALDGTDDGGDEGTGTSSGGGGYVAGSTRSGGGAGSRGVGGYNADNDPDF
ncbi:hypothetical protein CEUSTIGMA_g779.t1 [Chlamydomonas eustigma]|uniref:F5/8 type C domain-containing protein n=1 Tax=Chlamydomonas eustigma TaxID=1157962 RepID=A0A250WR55_9CHLO|nr:hypothetical protein CEUSTIGMA_g779.t1 [Chlamydomonas eustigma]|eukprot:GAX73325.1 hypothetical protein CEUSTIGMA_g779.t1 [Chlamydomonas eustigma]